MWATSSATPALSFLQVASATQFLSWRSPLRTPQLLAIFMWNPALATVWCTFCRPHFKNAPNMPVFPDFL
jgi:hypothetical protein